MIELVDLRLFQRFGARGKVGAGINHGLIEPQAVEVVGNIVVVFDGVRVFGLVMAQGAEQPTKLALSGHAHAHLGQAGCGGNNVSRQPIYIKVAVDVPLSQVVEAGRQKIAQRSRAGHVDRDPGLRPQIMVHAVPQLQAQRNVGTGLQAGQETGHWVVHDVHQPSAKTSN